MLMLTVLIYRVPTYPTDQYLPKKQFNGQWDETERAWVIKMSLIVSNTIKDE